MITSSHKNDGLKFKLSNENFNFIFSSLGWTWVETEAITVCIYFIFTSAIVDNIATG